MNRRWVRRPGTVGRSSWSRCVKKNNVATFRLTQTTAIDLMDGRPPRMPSNPGVNEILGTGHGADGPDIVWERSGYSGRGLVPSGAPGFNQGHHLGKRGEDRFIVQDLPGLDRQSQASLGPERRLAALAGPPVLCLARPADGTADLHNGLLPAQALGHDAGGQLGLRGLVLDFGDLVGGRGWQAPPLDLLLD